MKPQRLRREKERAKRINMGFSDAQETSQIRPADSFSYIIIFIRLSAAATGHEHHWGTFVVIQNGEGGRGGDWERKRN